MRNLSRKCFISYLLCLPEVFFLINFYWSVPYLQCCCLTYSDSLVGQRRGLSVVDIPKLWLSTLTQTHCPFLVALFYPSKSCADQEEISQQLLHEELSSIHSAEFESVSGTRHLEIQGRASVTIQAWRPPAAEFPFVWRKSDFCLLRPSTDWMRPTHTMEGNLFTQSPLIYTLISSKNTLTERPRIMFDQVSGHHGMAKLTYKINHHNREED